MILFGNKIIGKWLLTPRKMFPIRKTNKIKKMLDQIDKFATKYENGYLKHFDSLNI